MMFEALAESIYVSGLEYLSKVIGLYLCIWHESLTSCYQQQDVVIIALAMLSLFILYSFSWSIVGQNCSKVDQIWSITPVVFVLHILVHYHSQTGLWHVRLVHLSILVLLWGARLTFNFWRKGGYGNFFVHEEDYRWPILRRSMHPIVFWIVFNFSFIATYQNVLLFLIASPAFEIARTSPFCIQPQDVMYVFLLSEV
jgi:steroid 5-alpha reductase family enzyme